MKGYLLVGALIGASIICATAMYIYFSPFQTCMRQYSHLFKEDTVLTCMKR